ncbi:quinone-dependent dihydroorotate dehydrogenase [Rhodobacteraceae bacterium XHP0102]|nr:quinone-dependent dihydroorotate dehydrogenase [Rhodobacteraceae bacterium XHP0102]
MFDKAALAALRLISPERAHGIALQALNMGLAPRIGPITSPRLRTTVAGLEMPNPLGLAAGFDKNATAIAPLMQTGFGFLEVGAITPQAQPGNPHPRVFRLPRERAVINRFGFNNEGMEAAAKRLAARPHHIPLGLNLGANKTSTDRAADYALVLARCGGLIDFATINISSPNTENLRDLQAADQLERLLQGVMDANFDLAQPVPLFVKIAPDLSSDEIDAIAELALRMQLAGIIATNTTIARAGLRGRHSRETGGLSGQPLFERSTQVLARLAKHTQGEIALIGVGGVASADQAYAKIKAGAHAVQLYTGLVYGGMGLVADILHGLDAALARDGHANVAAAIGTGVDAWL